MLCNGHKLDGVVSVRLDARQNLFGKLPVRPDFFLLLRHADMGLINQQRLVFQLRRCMFKYIRCRGIPKLAREVLVALVLNHALDIHWNAFMLPDLRLHQHLQFATMHKAVGKLVVGQKDFPKAAAC